MLLWLFDNPKESSQEDLYELGSTLLSLVVEGVKKTKHIPCPLYFDSRKLTLVNDNTHAGGGYGDIHQYIGNDKALHAIKLARGNGDSEAIVEVRIRIHSSRAFAELSIVNMARSYYCVQPPPPLYPFRQRDFLAFRQAHPSPHHGLGGTWIID